MQEEGIIIWVVLPPVSSMLCLPLFGMSGLCGWPLSSQCKLLRGSSSHLEISRENKFEFFIKRNYFSANYRNKSCKALSPLKERLCQFFSFPRLRRSVVLNQDLDSQTMAKRATCACRVLTSQRFLPFPATHPPMKFHPPSPSALRSGRSG